MNNNTRLIIFTVFLVAIAFLCKYNFAEEIAFAGFSPIMAIAMFSGMLISKRSFSFLLPLIALLVSDIIIEVLFQAGQFKFPGFYPWQIFNYALLLGITLIGWGLKGKNYGSIAIGGIIAPTVFFLLSNFGSWIIDYGNLYTEDFSGLMTCYEAGLPFYRNALGATLIFLPAIMLCYNLLVKRTTALKVA